MNTDTIAERLGWIERQLATLSNDSRAMRPDALAFECRRLSMFIGIERERIEALEEAARPRSQREYEAFHAGVAAGVVIPLPRLRVVEAGR